VLIMDNKTETTGAEYRISIIEKFLEVEPLSTDDFLKVKETLTRIGIANQKTKTLFQSCHILHKRGKYYLVHFKELFALDGKCDVVDEEDITRRSNIALALESWNMIQILGIRPERNLMSGKFTVIKYTDKSDWTFSPKYIVGGNKIKRNEND